MSKIPPEDDLEELNVYLHSQPPTFTEFLIQNRSEWVVRMSLAMYAQEFVWWKKILRKFGLIPEYDVVKANKDICEYFDKMIIDSMEDKNA